MPPLDLFDAAAERSMAHRPLAERMRPHTLDAMLGHAHLLRPGGPLRRLAGAGRAPSLIVHGPPGSGKTTLAHALARAADVPLTVLSAVSAGLKEVREVIDAARRRRGEQGRGTWLFIDEIHRFNKAQQDALLPHIEAGLITFVGATTENPSFALNAALLSRCLVVALEALTGADLEALLQRALTDAERGLGGLRLEAAPGVLARIAAHSGGDARRALGTLEAAAALTQADGRRQLVLEDVAAAAQAPTLLHDRSGDAHFQLLSALIKSMRRSDADAAVYYLARLLAAGESPRVPLRRMVIFASEDIGPADPSALSVAVAAAQAFEQVGLPEGTLALTQLAIHLARAPKSRAVIDAFGAAEAAVQQHGALPVPGHLVNAGGAAARRLEHGRARAPAPGAPAHNLPIALVGCRFVAPERPAQGAPGGGPEA